MIDQLDLTDADKEKIIEFIPEGLSLDTEINREVQFESIINTLEDFLKRIVEDLKSQDRVNIIFPMDGSLLVEYELFKIIGSFLSAEEVERLNFIHSSKSIGPSGKKNYILSTDVNPSLKTYILDDIFDSGESSELIQKEGEIPHNNFNIVALTKKKGKSFQQNEHIYEIQNKWAASGWGMNSGKFGEIEIRDAQLSGRFIPEDESEGAKEEMDEYYKELLQIHLDIEVFERICANTYFIEDEDKLLSWRYNIVAAEKYLNKLKENCLYEGKELEFVLNLLRNIQQRSPLEKFEYLTA